MATPLYTDEEPGAMITDINVTPMVDIMLVLLIIFMVTATYIVRPSIEVDLPRASTADNVIHSSQGLTIKANGELLLNGRTVQEKPLFEQLQRAARAQSELQVILSGDSAVPHGRVVQMIDLLRRAGVQRFAIDVQLDQHALDHLK